MREFLSFKKIYAPILIQIIYWVGTAAAVLGGIAVIISSTRYYLRAEIIPGLLLLLLGPVVLRLWAEFMTAVFNMQRNLSDLRDVAVRVAYEKYESGSEQ